MREYLFKTHLPPSSMLPLEIKSDTSLKIVQKYAEICSIESEIIGSNLIFAILIPLIENNDYHLFELIPYPYSLHYPSLTFHLIIPLHKYLILYTKTNRYTMIDDLSHCIHIMPAFSLCQLHELDGVSNRPCEVGIRYEDTLQCTNRTRLIHAAPEV